MLKLFNHIELFRSLDSFGQLFSENPYKYIYEADFQIHLASHLEQQFPQPHRVALKEAVNSRLIGLDYVDIGKIHREYPAKNPFDVVVLDEENLNEIKGFGNIYSQPIKYALELKLMQKGCHGVIWADKSLDDCKKLIDKARNNKVKYAIHLTFCHTQVEVDEFLRGCDPKRRRVKHKEWFHDFYQKIEGSELDFSYFDMESGKLKSVLESL